MSGKRTIAVFIFLFLSKLIFLINCAEIAAPPGGEEDKSPPTIVQTVPANGSINVEPSNQISFGFSEGIIKPATAKPVFISPRQEKAPEINWKSDGLILKLAEPFASNQTYVVTVTAEITDWRRNKMDSTVTIAFSSGDKIDSGSISGYVLEQGKAKAGVLVGLYEQPLTAEEIQYDSIYPNYISQSSGDGSFKFRYLPDRNFRLVALDDLNRNDRFNPETERFAVPDRAIEFGSGQALDELYLELSASQALTLKINSAIITSDKLIKLRLNTPIQLAGLKNNLNQIQIKSISEPTGTIYVLGLLESHLDTSSVLTIYAAPLDTGGFSISIKTDSSPEAITFDELRVGESKDKNLPSIIKFSPDDISHFKDKLNIAAVFSEPIDTSIMTAQTFALANETEEVVTLKWTWTDPFHLLFQPGELNEGSRYTMTLAEFEIADKAGNLLGDSIQAFSYSILNSDSLGSVSGNISVEISNKDSSRRHLTFSNINGQQSYEFSFDKDRFTVELPAGKYLMSGFLDENNNGMRDLGMSQPYTMSETFGRSTDTVSVRARFETAGIEFIFK